MEEVTEDFQEMLNIMKVEEFKQAREQKKLASIFTQLKRWSNHKAQLFYTNNIYAKVLNAFMMARLQSIQYNHRLSIFYQKLQNIYFKMQLQTHFQAMKQFKTIRQQEREQKIKVVLEKRKKNQIQCFSNILRCKMFNKKQKRRVQAQRTPIKQAYKTDNLFNKQRFDTKNDLRQVMTKQNFYKKQLEQSRNSAKSAYSNNSQFGGRRKFATIKQLPKFPKIEEIQQKYPLKTEQEQKEMTGEVITQNRVINQQKIISSQIQKPNEQKDQNRKNFNLKSQKQVLKQKKQVKKYNRDSIIAEICKVKMLEIAQIADIINQYSTSLKYQSVINQKAFLSQSKATLQKIIKL